MIYTAVLYITKEPTQLLLPSDFAAAERVNEAKNPKLRQSRICAYNLLERAFYDLYSTTMPRLSFDKGKPCFLDSKIKISVSHTSDVCAVSFSDYEVGVDVQSYDEMLGKERVLERFVNKDLQKMIKTQKSPEVKYLFYEIKDTEICFKDCETEPVFEHENAKKRGALDAAMWSALEAVLKCRGGFCEYKNAESIIRAAKLKTVYLPTAALSVAVIE